MNVVMAQKILLVCPNHNLLFDISTDSSDYQMIAAIMQGDKITVTCPWYQMQYKNGLNHEEGTTIRSVCKTFEQCCLTPPNRLRRHILKTGNFSTFRSLG